MSDKKPTEVTDTIIYSGEIDRAGYERLSEECSKATTKRCLLVLTTSGGDPDAGFRIARCLRHHYPEHLTIYVPDYCKSAGTLICIAANELVIDDRGELGPLDVQVLKSDEILERSSGLDIVEALDYLQSEVRNSIVDALVEIRKRTRLGTKLAASMISDVVTGLYAEVYAQVDPVKLGALQRQIRIAFDYGQRLDVYARNLKDSALGKLITGYPAHSFVIDRKEAKELFKNVRPPHSGESSLRDKMRQLGLVDTNAAQILLVPGINASETPATEAGATPPQEIRHDENVQLNRGQTAERAEPAAGAGSQPESPN